MHCGSSWRPPRRAAFAGRLGLLVCVLVLAFGVGAGPATAYSCGAKSPAGDAAAKGSCEPEREPARPVRRGNADPMSFVFFMGILTAFVLVPIGLSPRLRIPPE
jgi:hypothetical protein